jgi:hypothetical protein
MKSMVGIPALLKSRTWASDWKAENGEAASAEWL